MGVAGLWSFLRAHAADAFTYEDEAGTLGLYGRVLCVDGAMMLTSSLKTTVTLDEDPEWLPLFMGSVLHKVSKIIRLTRRMPIVVLDGQHPDSKSFAHENRKKARMAAENKLRHCLSIGDEEGALKAKRACSRVSDSLEEIATLTLTEAGVPVQRAPGEAEGYCAEMCLSGEAWGVVGEDGDTILCGAPFLIRGICQGGRICLVSRDAVIKSLGLDPIQLRWMAALSGTDFHPGIRGVGPAREPARPASAEASP